jgi:hypothetical protein
MALEEVILRIDESTLLKGILLSESKFMEIKSGLELIDSKSFKNSVSRIYNYKNQYSVFEFFNRSAIQFDKIVQKEDLVNVEFYSVLFSSQKNEVTYIIDIEKAFYQSLQIEIESKVELEELDFFGEFYNLNNGSVLAKWSKGFRHSKFSILKNIRAMASIDPELLPLLDKEKNNSSIESEKLVENIKYDSVKFGEDTDMKLNDIKDRISKLLNFEKSILDFSLESIDVIEDSMIWNCDKISKFELFDLCYPYIGEVARRKYNLNWIKEDNLMILVDDKFNPLEFGFNLQKGIAQSDYMPTVKWVIEQLEIDLKRK